jgi:hypothetical protein
MTAVDAGAADAPVTDAPADTGDTGADLEAIAPDQWAEPAPLDDGVDSFDRPYVESLRKQAADYRTRAKESSDRWDGVDHEAATNGMYLAQSLQTPEGVREFFIEAGKALGINEQQVYALMSGQQVGQPAAAAEEDPDLDNVMTKREFLETLKTQVTEPQKAQWEQQQAQQKLAENSRIITDVIDNELKLGGDANAAERKIVLALADGYISPTETDPRKLVAAARQAKVEWDKTKAERFAAYAAEKKLVAAAVPKTLGTNTGGAASTQDEAPKSLADAIARRKAGKAGI